MGHLRLQKFPVTRRWSQVLTLLETNASTAAIAAASASAAKTALRAAAHDPVFEQAVWILVNAPIAARGPDFEEDLRSLGVELNDDPTLVGITSAVATALDHHGSQVGARTDLGELAHTALLETISAACAPRIDDLFGDQANSARSLLASYSSGDRFAKLARDFFARLTAKTLDTFLSRALSDLVGVDRRFQTDFERRAFDAAFSNHCSETARIVEEFAGGWYGKHLWQKGSFQRSDALKFGRYAITKLLKELERRHGEG
ncbi:MAG: hypothetical protein AAFU68_08115 [Pseudomonadota bacterium]